MASTILLNKSVYSIAIKENCLISIFMNINEKQDKEETLLISVDGMACDIYIFVSDVHYGTFWSIMIRETSLMQTKREREKTKQTNKHKLC